MQFKQRNIATMLVAKNINVSTLGGVDFVGLNINAFKGSMAAGETIVVNMAGVAVDAGTASTLTQQFRIATKLADGDVKFSDTIDAKMVKKVTCQRYVAGANQVDYIGYNGSTGAIDVIDDNVYKINMYIVGTDALDFSRMTVKHGVYKSDSSATQAEIAAGLTQSLISNFSREGMKLKYGTDIIKFDRVNSATGAEALGASDTLVGIKGSKYVTIVETGGTLPYLFVAGDYLRLGTTVTSPVYKITATTVTTADGGVLTLDIPLQESVSYSGTGAAMYITAANAAAGNFGIKMTGAEYPYSAFKLGYGRSSWRMGLDDFGSTTITNSVAMSLGSGNGKAVNELESWIALNRGNWYTNSVAVTYPVLESNTSSNYALIHIQYTDDYVTELGHGSDAHKELWIACPYGTGTIYTDADTGIGPVIDAYASKYSWSISYGTGTDGVANTTTAKAIESGAGA